MSFLLNAEDRDELVTLIARRPLTVRSIRSIHHPILQLVHDDWLGSIYEELLKQSTQFERDNLILNGMMIAVYMAHVDFVQRMINEHNGLQVVNVKLMKDMKGTQKVLTMMELLVRGCQSYLTFTNRYKNEKIAQTFASLVNLFVSRVMLTDQNLLIENLADACRLAIHIGAKMPEDEDRCPYTDIFLRDLVNTFLRLKSAVNEKDAQLFGNLLLCKAVSEFYAEACQILIKLGVKPTSIGYSGSMPIFSLLDAKPPLENESKARCAATVDTLCRLGIDKVALNLRDNVGSGTILHRASWRNDSIYLAKVLIDKGVDVTIKDARGKTSFHIAAERGRSLICSLLLQKGADVNSHDQQWMTPFMHITGTLVDDHRCTDGICSFEETFIYLAEHQTSNVLQRDASGENPLDKALSKWPIRDDLVNRIFDSQITRTTVQKEEDHYTAVMKFSFKHLDSDFIRWFMGEWPERRPWLSRLTASRYPQVKALTMHPLIQLWFRRMIRKSRLFTAHLLCCLFHLMFLVLLAAFFCKVSSYLRFFKFKVPDCSSARNISHSSHYYIGDWLVCSEAETCVFALMRIILAMMWCLMLVNELIQFGWWQVEYLRSTENYMDLLKLISTGIFVYFAIPFCRISFLVWGCGILGLMTSFFQCLWYCRSLPAYFFTGPFRSLTLVIVMYFKILEIFLWFLPITLVVLLLFIIIFHSFFASITPSSLFVFPDVVSLVYTMANGEYNFAETFSDNNLILNQDYGKVMQMLYPVFQVTAVIALTNLIIAQAVGDISELKLKSTQEFLLTQQDTITSLMIVFTLAHRLVRKLRPKARIEFDDWLKLKDEWVVPTKRLRSMFQESEQVIDELMRRKTEAEEIVRKTDKLVEERTTIKQTDNLNETEQSMSEFVAQMKEDTDSQIKSVLLTTVQLRRKVEKAERQIETMEGRMDEKLNLILESVKK